MSAEAQEVDIALSFNYFIEINDLRIALIRKANIPKRSYATVNHAHAGQRNTRKQAGKKTIGIMTLESALLLDGFDSYFETWMKQNDTLPKSQLQRSGIIGTLDSSETGARNQTWEFQNAHVMSLDYSPFDGGSEDAVVLTIELEIEDCFLIGA